MGELKLSSIDLKDPNRSSEYTHLQKQLLQQAFRNSLFHTAQTLCGFKDINYKTHAPIFRALQNSTKRKLICVPRGTFKSSIACIAYPIWLIINNPNVRILIDSELAKNSQTFFRQIKLVLQSELFFQIFGDIRSDKWNETELIVNTRNDFTLKEPTLMYGGVGTALVSKHFDVIIGDDYHSPQNSQTPELRKKIIEHYRYNISILEQKGIYTVIGTRYSDDDLIGWLIKNQLGFKDEKDLKKQKKENGVFNVSV